MNSNYLLICKDKSDNGKRLQRRFRKQNINANSISLLQDHEKR